jgi:hypothetical protein
MRPLFSLFSPDFTAAGTASVDTDKLVDALVKAFRK